MIDANGNHAQFAYDGFDRLQSWTFPSTARPASFDGSSQANALASAGALNSGDYEQYGYDANGNRTSLRKRDGQVIGFTFDALNRMWTKDAPGTSDDVTYGYDLQGHQLSAVFTTGGQGVSNQYDGFGRLTASTTTMGGASRTLGYGYDADGNRQQLSFADGQYVTYEYDGLDRLQAIRDNGGTQLLGFIYDAKGNPVQRTRANNATTAAGYDDLGRLRCLSHDLAGAEGAPVCSDSALTASNKDMALRFSYNAASQMIQRDSGNNAYAWGGSFNVVRPYASNGLNQYTSAGPAAFAYDANGNLTSDGATSYSYDVENRLTSASGALNASLAYDPQGRLFQTSGAYSAATQFLYSGDELVAEYDGGGTLLRRYVHGPAEDDPMVWYEGASLSDRRFLHTDHQGSIVAITDGAANPIAIDSYDEYGIPARTNIGRFQYTGQAWIPELAMYHYKARIYSPTLGRFLQTDPIGYKDQVNLYEYVADDPMDHTDPTGSDTYEVNRSLQTFGDSAKPRWDPISHTFVVTTNADGSITHTYSWGNTANMRGWNMDQGLDRKTAREALSNGLAEKVGNKSLDRFVRQAFSMINSKDREHTNWWVTCNCKTEASGLVKDAKSLRALSTSMPARSYDAIKINSNNTVTATFKNIGSLIQHSTTCDAQGRCTSN